MLLENGKKDPWPHSTRTEKGSMNAELGCSVKGLTLESSPLQNSHVWFCRFGHILCVLERLSLTLSGLTSNGKDDLLSCVLFF